jgi:hypothetical protein
LNFWGVFIGRTKPRKSFFCKSGLNY